MHVTGCSIFSIILPGLWASIGVSLSYSSRPFLCALECSILILLDMPCSRNLNQATRYLPLGGWVGPGWLGIRLFAALIRNTCSLVPRFLPMGKILVTRLEYMYVFDHFCHCTQGSHKFMMTCIDTNQYRANI